MSSIISIIKKGKQTNMTQLTISKSTNNEIAQCLAYNFEKRTGIHPDVILKKKDDENIESLVENKFLYGHIILDVFDTFNIPYPEEPFREKEWFQTKKDVFDSVQSNT